MKKSKKILSLMLAAIFSVAILAGCAGEKTTDATEAKTDQTQAAKESAADGDSDQSEASKAQSSGDKVDPTAYDETMDVTITIMTGFTQMDSKVEKMLEDKYNVNIDLLVLPGWTDGRSKISMLMAGNEMPDMIWWWGMDNEFLQWKEADMLVDVSEYMNTYTNIRDYYNKMNPNTLFYATEDDGSIYRIPGDVSEPSCECLWIRQDWLDALEKDVPETIEELEEVMRAFTEDDPDGNGLDDTYGLGGDGYDFRTFWPWFQGYDNAHWDRFMVDSNGDVVYAPVTDDTKNAMESIAKLYKNGWVTPNITQDTDRDEEMANGGFGVAYTWCNYINPDAQPMVSFKAANPEGNWVPIPMVAGPNGNPQDNPANSQAWCYFAITKTAADPERLFAMYDDMCSMENYIARRYGTEGEEYTIENGVYNSIIAPASEDDNAQNIGLELFHNLFNRKDEANLINTPEAKALFDHSGAASRDRAALQIEWKNPASLVAWVENRTDIEDEKTRFMWSLVGGDESIDDWDTYVALLDSLGLQDVLAEAQSVFDLEKGKLDDYMSNKVNQK